MLRHTTLLLLLPSLLLAQATAPATLPTFDPGTPRAAVESLSLALAAGDADQIRSLLLATTDTERQMVDAMVAMSQSIARLRQVAIKRYDESAARALTGDPRAAAAEQHARLETAFQTVERDRAILTFPDPAADPITLRHVDGRWVIPVADKAAKLPPDKLATRAADLAAAARVIDGVAAECATGRWDTPEDVGMAIQNRILKDQQSRLPSTQPSPTPATQPQ